MIINGSAFFVLLLILSMSLIGWTYKTISAATPEKMYSTGTVGFCSDCVSLEMALKKERI